MDNQEPSFGVEEDLDSLEENISKINLTNDEENCDEQFSTSSSSSRQEIVMSKALGSDLVLRSIFKYLDLSNHLNCRLVDHKWRHLTSLEMLDQESVSLSIEYFKWLHTYRIKGSAGSSSKVLDDLNEFLTTSINFSPFPCPHLAIKGGDLTSPDLQKFLSIHGQHIKTLTFETLDRYAHPAPNNDHDPNCPTLATLSKLLLVQAPHIKHLEFKSMVKEWKDENLFGDGPATLPKLEKLSLPNNDPFTSQKNRQNVIPTLLTKLLESAPNLRIVDGFKLYLLPCFTATKKFDTINSLLFDPHEEDDVTLYPQLTSSIVNLKEIKLGLSAVYNDPKLWPTVASTLNLIFDTHGSTLKKIHFGIIGFLTGIELLPVFDNVTEIYFESPHVDYDAHLPTLECLPHGQFLSEIFPAPDLKVTLHISNYCFADLDAYFPFYDFDVAGNVTSLVIMGEWHVKMDKIGQMFPKVLQLEIHFFEVVHFAHEMPSIFKYLKELTHLTIQFKKIIRKPKEPHPDIDSYFIAEVLARFLPDHYTRMLPIEQMDSALTGIPAKVCRHLSKLGHDEIKGQPEKVLEESDKGHGPLMSRPKFVIKRILPLSKNRKRSTSPGRASKSLLARRACSSRLTKFEDIRRGPSITDLSSLKSFIITLSICDGPVFSSVADRYAFDQLRQNGVQTEIIYQPGVYVPSLALW